MIDTLTTRWSGVGYLLYRGLIRYSAEARYTISTRNEVISGTLELYSLVRTSLLYELE